MNLEEPNYPPQKLTLLLKNRASKKKEASIPSIHFQVRTVSFRESLSFSFIFNFQIEVWTWPAAKTTKGTEGIWEKLSSHSLGPQLLCQKKTPGSCLDTATGGIWSLAPRNTKKHSLKRLKNVKKMEGDHSDTKFQKKKTRLSQILLECSKLLRPRVISHAEFPQVAVVGDLYFSESHWVPWARPANSIHCFWVDVEPQQVCRR